MEYLEDADLIVTLVFSKFPTLNPILEKFGLAKSKLFVVPEN